MLRTRMDTINTLLRRGVLNAQRTVTAQADYFQSKGRYDEIESQGQAAAFELAQAQREIENFDVQRRSTRADELAELETQIADNENEVAAIETITDVMRKSNIQSKLAMGGVTYQIVRRSGGVAKIIDANETTLLEPGDVLRISPGKRTIAERASAARRMVYDLTDTNGRLR